MCHDLFTLFVMRHETHLPNSCEKHPVWGVLQHSQWKFYLDIDFTSSLSCSPEWRASITSQPSRRIYDGRFTVRFAFVFLFVQMFLLLLASFSWEVWEFFCNASCFLSYIDVSQTSMIILVHLGIATRVPTSFDQWISISFEVTE